MITNNSDQVRLLNIGILSIISIILNNINKLCNNILFTVYVTLCVYYYVRLSQACFNSEHCSSDHRHDTMIRD